MLRPVKKTSLAGSVFEQIRGLIVSGELSAGDELPAERQLSETLGVNRSAVREALKRLEQAGLIAIQHGGSTRVLEPMRHAGPGLLARSDRPRSLLRRRSDELLGRASAPAVPRGGPTRSIQSGRSTRDAPRPARRSAQ